MHHKNVFEAINRTFRDIMQYSDPNYIEEIFGLKTVLLWGDFRPILPIVTTGRRDDTVGTSINEP